MSKLVIKLDDELFFAQINGRTVEFADITDLTANEFVAYASGQFPQLEVDIQLKQLVLPSKATGSESEVVLVLEPTDRQVHLVYADVNDQIGFAEIDGVYVTEPVKQLAKTLDDLNDGGKRYSILYSDVDSAAFEHAENMFESELKDIKEAYPWIKRSLEVEDLISDEYLNYERCSFAEVVLDGVRYFYKD